MPCDIASSLKGGCQTVFGLKFFNSIFSSTLWTAFLITTIVILLMMILIPVESETPVWLLFKFMFYTFVSTISILFLHNGTLSIKNEEEREKEVSPDLLARLGGKEIDVVNKGVEVKPNIESTLGAEERVFQHFGV